MTTEQSVNQQVLNTVGKHLDSMSERSAVVNPAGDLICQYRGANGSKCALGVLIPNEAYLPEMEGCSEHDAWPAKHIRMYFFEEYRDADLELLGDLQLVHDAIASWNDTGFVGHGFLAGVARDYGLEYERK